MGSGSTFRCTVRLEKQPTIREASVSSGDLRGRGVFIVDDNATSRKILQKQVASWGLVEESAENGWRALEMLRAAADRGEPYELVILDMQMPGMDGMELARRIKADPDLSSAQLVLLTSIGRRGEGEEARQAGIGAYLTKPVRQSELYDALAAVTGAPTEAAPDEETQLITRHSLRERKAGIRARLLVAEDNPVNQKVALRMLENLGYRVDVVKDGTEALKALVRTSYVAVLMDLQMPEMDGYEATAEIRKRESLEGRHTPIIAMTASVMEGDREKALAAGMDDYVSKPVKPDELDEVLKRWVPQAKKTSGAKDLGEDGARTTRGSSIPVLDPGVLGSLRGLQKQGEPDVVTELVEIFVGDVPVRMKELREALSRGDATRLKQAAHALKGSSANLGARRMAHTAERLEALGRSGDLSSAPALLEKLEADFVETREELSALIVEG